jgi:hypothetical protein
VESLFGSGELSEADECFFFRELGEPTTLTLRRFDFAKSEI